MKIGNFANAQRAEPKRKNPQYIWQVFVKRRGAPAEQLAGASGGRLLSGFSSQRFACSQVPFSRASTDEVA